VEVQVVLAEIPESMVLVWTELLVVEQGVVILHLVTMVVQ
jgi:hypothetical protein